MTNPAASGRPGIGEAEAAFGTLVAMDGSAPLDRAEVLLFWLCVPAMCDLPFEELCLAPCLPCQALGRPCQVFGTGSHSSLTALPKAQQFALLITWGGQSDGQPQDWVRNINQC